MSFISINHYFNFALLYVVRINDLIVDS